MKSLPLLFVLLIGSSPLLANHLWGGDINWTCLGNDSIKVELSLYTDCNGFDSSVPHIMITSKCSTYRVNFKKATYQDDITPVCARRCTRCDSTSCTFRYGVKKTVYSEVVYFGNWIKNGCSQFDIYFKDCCRTGSITTGGANQNLYIDAQIDLSNGCIDAPKWHEAPALITCLGRDFSRTMGAFSNDLKDSLVHSLVAPKTGSNSYTTWSGSYSGESPLYYLGFPKKELRFPRGIHFDTLTSLLRFRPMKEELSLLKTKVEVYNGGKPAGYITRDAAIVVMKCPTNNPPVIFNSQGLEFGSVCMGDTAKISMIATDWNDTIKTRYSTNIPNTSVKVHHLSKGADSIEITIIGSPSLASNKPYYLYVSTTDNACPVSLSSSIAYPIYIGRNSVNKYAWNIDHMGCNKYRVNALNGTGITEWLLNDNLHLRTVPALDTVNFELPGPGKYVIKGLLNGCSFGSPDTLSFLSAPIINAGDNITVCNDAVGVEITPRPIGGTWKDNLVTKTGILRTDKLQMGSQHITYQYVDSNQCVARDSFVATLIDQKPAINIKKLLNTCVKNDRDTLLGFPKGGYWTGIGTDTVQNDLVLQSRVLGIGTRQAIYTYTDSFYCTNSDTTTITFHPEPVARFELISSVVDAGDTIAIKNTSKTNGPASFEWLLSDLNRVYTDSAVHPVFTISDPGRYDVLLRCLDSTSGCTDSTLGLGVLDVLASLVEKGKIPIQIAPNPVGHQLYVKGLEEPVVYKIITLEGKTRRSGKLNPGDQYIDLGSLSGGIYFVTFNHRGIRHQLRFTKL